MANRITPFVKRMRTTGGTIFTFASSVEDIGLNINERNNDVKISHFALLNIPDIKVDQDGELNKFNVRNIVGNWQYSQDDPAVKDGRVLIAESFQNYALNLESNILNQSSYNPEINTTVSERVFWKWLKETGAIRWSDPSTAGSGERYWREESMVQLDEEYNPVVKYIGKVSAGNVRTDTFGTYNETYILVPTSHGQTKAFFKEVVDDNYFYEMEIGDLDERILGRETYNRPHPDGLDFRAYYDFVENVEVVGSYEMFYDDNGSWQPGWWQREQGVEPVSTTNSYIMDVSPDEYIGSEEYSAKLRYFDGTNEILFKRSKLDCVSLELQENNLREIFGDSTLTYDKMATGDNQISNSFEFNTVLIYYTVKNQQGEVLATNLMGVMFLDAPSGNTTSIDEGTGILLPSLQKLASTENGFGTSYSLRLNIKTDNIVDDTQALVVDFATSDQLWGEEWTDVFDNLRKSVNIMSQQSGTIKNISEQYRKLQEQNKQLVEKINSFEREIDLQAGTFDVPGDSTVFYSYMLLPNGRYQVTVTANIAPETLQNISALPGNLRPQQLVEYSMYFTEGNASWFTVALREDRRLLSRIHVNANGVISILNQHTFTRTLSVTYIT